MQYDTIEELTLEFSLYPNRKKEILKDCAKHCKYGWFTVAKDGNCALFDDNGDLDDLSRVNEITFQMVKRNEIENINIPDGVKYIGADAFYFCEKLVDAVVPDNVIHIGSWAFGNCTSLESITIGRNVKFIGFSAFANCVHLRQIFFKGKTLEEVRRMEYFSWNMPNISAIECEGDR